MTGGTPSILMTDAYKFSMGQAGFPLREETFYLSFRTGGRYTVPFDLAEVVRGLLPASESAGRPADLEYLRSTGYDMTPAMALAVGGGLVKVRAIPAGCVFLEGEPVLSVTGPSFLVSWLEPMVVWLHFPIQVATAIAGGTTAFNVCSGSEAELVRLTADAAGRRVRVSVRKDRYRSAVRRNMRALARAAGGSAERLLEVGMRAAGSLETHRMALEVCRDEGLSATSNVFLARELGMRPAGTSGHEHQQRWFGDLAGFRAMRDMRSATPGYLFDTYDPERIGIPAVVRVMREDPARRAIVRFDSGDKKRQFRMLREAELRHGLSMTYVFMDAIGDREVADFDRLGAALGVDKARILYGVGGFLVGSTAPHGYERNGVAAVYKLCRSGGQPVMKFSGEAKQSLPGSPVVARVRDRGRVLDVIRQEGEPAGGPEGGPWVGADVPTGHRLSPWTRRLIRDLLGERERQAMELKRDPGRGPRSGGEEP
jgi:nicotinic acid phosphoribosyltransferase